MRVWELAEELRVLSADVLELIKPHDAYVSSHLATVPRQALDAIRADPPEPRYLPGEWQLWHRDPPTYLSPTIGPGTAPRRPRRSRRRRPGPKLISYEPPYEEDEHGYGNNPTEELRYEPIWSTRDVASYYGVTPATVRRWVHRGHLHPCGKDGPSHVFNRNDVQAAVGAIAARRKQRGRRVAATQADNSNTGLSRRALQRLIAVTPDSTITANEAATLLGLAPSTIRVWVHRGHLKPVTRRTDPGHRRDQRFRLADLEAAFMKRRR